jgi:ferredoxin
MVTATLRFIPEADVPGWLAELAKTQAVYAPVRQEGQASFARYRPGQALALDQDAVTPPKEAVFPQTKALMRFAFRHDPENPGQRRLDIKEDLDESPALVFGARPCGVRGFATFDGVFGSPEVTDPYYQARRENTVFMTMACAHPKRSCFCHYVGGSPDDPQGSDVLLTPAQGGYLAQAVTEKGEALLAKASFALAPEREMEALAVHQKAREILGEPLDIARLPEALKQAFANLTFWEDMTAGCVGCGACTYLCPTCYCFNLTDESDGQSGVRLRTWDSCMFAQYSLEASGHNPRPTKAHRLRNRINRKFWYHPKNHGGLIACCGCGRCTRHCPGSVDLRHIIQEALKLHEG